MSFNRSRAVVLVALICVSALAACDHASETSAEGGSAAAKPTQAKRKVAQLPADMVAAVSAEKNAESVGVHFALGALPAVGKPLPVRIAIVPHQLFTEVSAHFEPREGLELTSGENFGPVTDAKSETPLEHTLVLVPTQEGVFMVTVSLDTEGEEGNFTRIFTIPVIVGMNPAVTPPAAK
jgi:hypothetical protein